MQLWQGLRLREEAPGDQVGGEPGGPSSRASRSFYAKQFAHRRRVYSVENGSRFLAPCPYRGMRRDRGPSRFAGPVDYVHPWVAIYLPWKWHTGVTSAVATQAVVHE